MGTLTFTLCDEVTGTLTGEELDDIDISAELMVDGQTIGSVDFTHTPEIYDEVTIQAEGEFEVEPADLHGTREQRIQFAADMTAAVVEAITAQRDHAREALAAQRAKHDQGQQAICDLRAAGMKLAAVWPAVVEAFGACCVDAADEKASAAVASIQIRRASAKVLAALRTLGLEPESKTGTES